MKQFSPQRPPSLIDLQDPTTLSQYFERLAKFCRTITTARTITSSDSVKAEEYWVRADATSGAITVTLPPVGEVGRPIGVMKVDSSSNAVTVDGSGSETINGSTTVTLSDQYDAIVIRDNGTSWNVEILQDAKLTTIAGLTPTDGNIIVGDGTTWVVESGNTARTSLGLGTGDSPQFTAVNIGHASDTTLTRASAGNLAVEGNALYRAGGTDVALADGGTGASLSDPGADRIMFWDDSEGATGWLTAGTGLTISGTTISAAEGGGSALDDLTDVVITTPSDGQVLTYDSGTSEWKNENSAAGFTNPMTTAGDIIIGDTGGAAIRLAVGTSGQVLKVVSSAPAWADDSGIQKSIIDAKGDLIVGTAADTSARLAVGTNTHVLTADSAESSGVKWAAALGAWTDFTPTWTTTGTAPSLGNGTLAGRYKLLDSKTALVKIHFTAGSTTTFGTGEWRFSLPVTAIATDQWLPGWILDSGTDNKLCGGNVQGTSVRQIVAEAANTVTNTVPMTWANGDQLILNGALELA